MKYALQKALLFFCILQHISLPAPSMVYNFRIAQITKQPLYDNKTDKNTTLIALPFEQFRQKYDGITQNFGGILGSYIYDFKPYYFRADCGLSHIHETTDHKTTFSGTEANDILFTVGRTFTINDRAPITFSGLLGFPTHQIYKLQHVDFGYGQVGTGVQCDGLYAFNNASALLYGARYLIFCPANSIR